MRDTKDTRDDKNIMYTDDIKDTNYIREMKAILGA